MGAVTLTGTFTNTNVFAIEALEGGAGVTFFGYGGTDDIYLSYGTSGALYMRSGNNVKFTLTAAGNCTIAGTLTVNGDQTGATDHVFDDYDDLSLLEKWRAGEELPFERGDMLNRDRLLRDTIIQQAEVINNLKARLDKLEQATVKGE